MRKTVNTNEGATHEYASAVKHTQTVVTRSNDILQYSPGKALSITGATNERLKVGNQISRENNRTKFP